MFEGSNIPLKKWFFAIYMFLSHKKGISSVQLAKDIRITQKTAWFMLNRIRHNFKGKTHISFDNETQIDETYVGGKTYGRAKGTQGRSLKFKIPVVGLISNRKAYTMVVPNTGGKVLKTIVRTLVKQGSTIVTDGWKGYNGLSNEYIHKVIEHSNGVYVKDGFHTNSIEGFWSHLKRGIIGIYHLVSPKHLQKYCDEFEFRYNTRDMSDGLRFTMFVSTSYRRLKYKDLANGEYAWY
jgi:transposase-like protein